MQSMEDNSVGSVVTDPPYGLSKEPNIEEVLTKWLSGEDYKSTGKGFMGKSWDSFVPGPATWKEVFRVLKPGGYILCFAGTRTQDLMSISLRLAGFEIRDSVSWVYGSGFPKSQNIGKAIDKVNAEMGREYKFTEWMRTTGLSGSEINKITNTNMGGHYLTSASQPAIPTAGLWAMLRPHIEINIPAWVDELVERIEAERDVVGKGNAGLAKGYSRDIDAHKVGFKEEYNITAPATPEAQKWEGWGSNLKPAHEPIILARKPLAEKTITGNVLKWGAGGINIDGCRVGFGISEAKGYSQGRFPANLIHDGSEEVKALFPETKSGKTGTRTNEGFNDSIYGKGIGIKAGQANGEYGDSCSASRYFKNCPADEGDYNCLYYCAKASKKERNIGLDDSEETTVGDGRKKDIDNPFQRGKTKRKNSHPTVKPLSLMAYLVRLVTPPGGVVLDPFCGSGTTGMAAVKEGFDFIGIEMEAEYAEIAKYRIEQEPVNKQGSFF